jgi:hypothetical protein
MEAAVGELVHSLRDARDADVVLDEVVVLLEVRVAERPVLAVPVVGRGLEVEVAETVALAAPDVGAAADRRVRPCQLNGLSFGVVYGSSMSLQNQS